MSENDTASPLDPDALKAAVEAARTAFDEAGDLDALAAAKPAHLGDRAPIPMARRSLGQLPGPERADAGKRVNAARAEAQAAFDARREVLLVERDARVLAEEAVDVTLPWDRRPRGARHPITQLSERIADIFVGMGWEVAEGPELEHEWFNFDALNFDVDHPARQMQDTFFVDPIDRHLVMRTHTSPVQVRSMLDRELPVYVVCPGRVYRTDEFDATHLPVFSQVEGLVIDKGITMAHLKGTLDHFARVLFGPEAKTRLRTNYFPFTEPSAEIDVSCFICKGAGCNVCKYSGWVEIAGSGMVDPNVLANCGIDPEEYTGFAFGMGIERITMLRYGIRDLRLFTENDVRFLSQFQGA